MARKGRELELLVAHLEECLNKSKSEIEIKSPDKIIDKITGNSREIDVSLRAKIGSHDVLIILECRSREKIDDTTWIEQLATKRDDIGANKAIAVSSLGFTSGAVLKAQNKNIELRTVKQISIDDIRDWFKITALKNYTTSLDVKANLYLRYPHKDSKRVNIFLKSFNDGNMTDKKILLDQGDTNSVSVNDLLQRKYTHEISECVHRGDFKLKKQGILSPRNQGTGFQLQIDDKNVVVNFIEYNVEFKIEVKESGIQSVKTYQSDKGTLADVIKFEHSDNLKDGQSFEMVGIPEEGGRRIGIRIVNNSQDDPKK